ncbi:hypothetical protein TRFO_39410 [Tritrichomonas foetus]|uniref:Uncharacterized protein n=1 Tax=Tritrichomonas foetus TaxID=1144522 RepID=A0A1J4J524_9EUKA|nr:hypothetical protein TRFO_39410 [Tritrichomonas foetus]|eukprot:OHS94400.1 hypothetical protein TRFO_39410 [Tritrichomonas foetus]
MFVIFLLAFVSGGGGICFNPDPNFGCAGLSIEAEATFHNVSSLINHISKQTSNSFIYINSTRDYSFNISFHDFGFQNEGRNTVSLIGMTHNLIKSKIAIFFDKRGNSKFLFNDISFENLDVIFQPFDEDIVLQGRSFTEKYSNFNIGFFIFDNSFHFDKFQQSENLSNNESNSKTDELFDDNLKENSSEKWYQNENNIFLNQKNSTKNDLITSDKNEHFNLHFLNQIDNCINETSHESLNLFTSKQTNDYPKNCTIVIDFNEKYKIKLLDIYYLDVSDEFLQCVKNISYQLLTMEIRVASLNHIFNKYHETGNFSGQTIQMSKNSHPDFQKDNFSEHLPKTVKKEYRHYCQYTNHSDDKKEIDPNKDNIYHSVFLLQKTVNTYNSIIVLINNGTEPVYHQCVSTRHFTLFYFGFFLEFMTANKTALEYTLYEGSSITVDSLLIENDPVVSFNIYGLGNNNVNLTGKTIDIRTIILNQGKLINNAHSSFKDITLYKDVYFYSDMNFAISGKLEIKGNVTIGTTKRYLQGFVENLLLREGEFSLLNNIFTQFELIVMYLVAGNTIDSAEPIFMLNIPLTVVYSIQNGHTSIRASELILFSKETRIEYYFDSLSSLDITLQPIFVNTIKYEVDNMVDQKTFHTLLKRNPYFLKMNQKSKSKSNLYHYNYIHSQKNNIEKKTIKIIIR